MKIKTSELTGAALDWAVAMCEETSDNFLLANNYGGEHFYRYSMNWLSGGPIIEREIARLEDLGDEGWEASGYGHTTTGPTPLIAAMRCYVASKLGDEVEIPKELC